MFETICCVRGRFGTARSAPPSPLPIVRIIAGLVAATVASASGAQVSEAAARAMIAKYAASYDSAGLLNEAAVRAALTRMVGAQLRHLERNLDVTGAVDVVGSALSVSGNAAHKGTAEEAVVCVLPLDMSVEAAILSRGAITVYTRAAKYEYASLCIKDWITLANSRHVDRLKQPRNVRMGGGR